MKLKNILLVSALACAGVWITSCNNSTSYADLINQENYDVNRFLADQRVVGEIPADSVFLVGADAPYYQIDDEANIFMQVLNVGDPDSRAQLDDLVYFRFMCANLAGYTSMDKLVWTGNALNLDQVLPTSFRYGNYQLESSYQWGSGLQLPLKFLGYNCEVNIIIKSQYGPTSTMSAVQPYIYNVRYYRSQI